MSYVIVKPISQVTAQWIITHIPTAVKGLIIKGEKMNKKFSILIIAAFVFMFSATANAETFFAYLEGRQEAPAVATSATGYARVFLNEQAGTITFRIVFNNLSSNQTLSHLHTGAIGVSGPVAINTGAVGGTSGVITGSAAITAAQITALRQHLLYVNVHTTNFGSGEIRGQLGGKRPVDFDGDGKQDYSVMRFPAAGTPRPIQFWNQNSTTGPVISSFWGDALRDFPVPGDYDGDGMDDYALYRSSTVLGGQSEFWILTSNNNTVLYYAWGLNGPIGGSANPSDLAIPRDYDGDGITDVATVRRGTTTGDPLTWYIRQSSNNTARVVHWGVTGAAANSFFDAPCPGDYDGDGKFDLAIYRFGTPPDNNFIVLKSSGGVIYQPWGNFTTDYIAPGDFDGDGRWDFVAARTGAAAANPMVWHILHATGAITQRTFGISSDVPVQGDYDGDAKTDIAIVREGATAAAATNFWVFNSFDNTTSVRQWGVGADFPIAIFDAR